MEKTITAGMLGNHANRVGRLLLDGKRRLLEGAARKT